MPKRYIITGKFVRSYEELAFDSCQVELPALTHWCFPAAIQRTILFKDDKTTVKKMSLTIDAEKTENPIISVELEGTEIGLWRNVTYCWDVQSPEQSTVLAIKKPNKEKLGSFLHDIHIYEQYLLIRRSENFSV